MLPYAIEWLLTQKDESGARLCYQGISQTIIPLYPPGQLITLQLLPFGTDFCDIVFQSAVAPAVVPNVFYFEGVQYGNRDYVGMLGSWTTNNNMFSYVPIKAADPALMRLENVSPVVQYYEGMVGFVSIKSQEHYDLILERLERRGTSDKIEALAEDCKTLLNSLVEGGGGGLQPPIGGPR